MDIDLNKLAGHITANYSYEELYESAYIGTLSYLENLTEEELLEEIELSGYKEE